MSEKSRKKTALKKTVRTSRTAIKVVTKRKPRARVLHANGKVHNGMKVIEEVRPRFQLPPPPPPEPHVHVIENQYYTPEQPMNDLRILVCEGRYPVWVKQRLTPDIEIVGSLNLNDFHLPILRVEGERTGLAMYKRLLKDQVNFVPTPSEGINRCLSIHHLMYAEWHPNEIPLGWMKARVFALKTVAVQSNGKWNVPYLDCTRREPFIGWRRMDHEFLWNDHVGMFDNMLRKY